MFFFFDVDKYRDSDNFTFGREYYRPDIIMVQDLDDVSDVELLVDTGENQDYFDDNIKFKSLGEFKQTTGSVDIVVMFKCFIAYNSDTIYNDVKWKYTTAEGGVVDLDAKDILNLDYKERYYSYSSGRYLLIISKKYYMELTDTERIFGNFRLVRKSPTSIQILYNKTNDIENLRAAIVEGIVEEGSILIYKCNGLACGDGIYRKDIDNIIASAMTIKFIAKVSKNKYSILFKQENCNCELQLIILFSRSRDEAFLFDVTHIRTNHDKRIGSFKYLRDLVFDGMKS